MMRKTAAVLFAVLLCVTTLLAVLYTACTLPSVMTRRFAAFAQPDIPAQDHAAYAREITDYLKGASEAPAFFNARERAHMADVRALVLLAKTLLLCAAAAAVPLGVITIRSGLRRVARRALLASVSAVVLLTAYGAFDFGGLFTLFHQAAFSNDLWMLDPRTDMLIRLMPEPFFRAYALSCALVFLFLCAVLYGVMTERGIRWITMNGAFKRRKPSG